MASTCGWLATLLAVACAAAGSPEPKSPRTVPEKADRILVVSDSPNYYSRRDLKRLYPGLVDEHDVTHQPITAKIVATSDPATRGFAVGNEVYRYRNTNDVDEPPVGHYTYREVICEDDPKSGRKVLARSTMTGGAMWIEERFEGGGIILAYDLFSPLDLCLTQGDPWVLHRGTFSKYIPAGNLFGGTVRYGRYVNRKLTVEEVFERIRKLAQHPKVEVRNEGPSSEETPMP